MSVEVALEQVKGAVALLNQSIGTLIDQLQLQHETLLREQGAKHEALLREQGALKGTISELERVVRETMPPKREASGTFPIVKGPEAPAYKGDSRGPGHGVIDISSKGAVRISPAAMKWIGRALLALSVSAIGYLSRYLSEADSHGAPPSVSSRVDGGP